MTEHNNPGPPEQCYDDCPTNRTGDTEDCTCAGTSAVRSWMDTAEQLTRERDSAAAEAGRVREELADVRASREAWAIEADRLDAELKKRPTAWAYEQADRALEKRRVALVEALGARPGAGFYDSVDDVAALLRDQAALSGMLRGMARRASAMRRALRARPAIPADAVAKPDGVLYALLLVWLDSPMNRESPESAAAAAASAVNWFLRAAPVSGSDTTEDGGDRG